LNSGSGACWATAEMDKRKSTQMAIKSFIFF
jgi:hypothetical protein